jgi:hypothetical protein
MAGCPSGMLRRTAGRVGVSWGGDDARSVPRLRRAGVRAVRLGAAGQRLAQGRALDAVGHGDAVAILVGQGGAGGQEQADDLELEVAGSGGSAGAGGGDGQVQRGRACLGGGGAGAGAGGQQGGDGGRAAGADRAVQGVTPPRSGWTRSTAGSGRDRQRRDRIGRPGRRRPWPGSRSSARCRAGGGDIVGVAHGGDRPNRSVVVAVSLVWAASAERVLLAVTSSLAARRADAIGGTR